MCQGVEHRVKEAIGAEAIGVFAAGIPTLYYDLTQVRDEDLPTFSMKDLRRDQMEDSLCSLTLKAMESGHLHLLLVISPKGACLVHTG